MKTSTKLSFALATATLAVAGFAQAQSTMQSGGGMSMYSPGATYLGFNLGQSSYRLNNGSGGFPSDQRKTSYNLYGGSYFNEYLGVELGYIDFGSIARAGGSTKASAFNVGLVGKFPVGMSFNVLGRLGASYGRTDVSSSPASGIVAGNQGGWGSSYGVGGEYMFNTQMSAVLQYDEYNLKFAGGNRDRINSTSVGLRYKF